ncbi:hypothetical protein FHR81_000834 [Actinoalloteichus hoggarensis]|uniref:Uncharacterized protein n=1 Tax=Actinoalloteichus hoggarensis TaxID=1470176 RepID=A0A221W138_9PSEU|nr:hypothetical protein [Actinoalloteichus hoggarensis]ASO19489.1 hypothetical protein AHOG_09225 [Actinoalloteichus hoggarensis]MBB5919805.1 hypothetical protein [Actinoalloteichus hoggarensis]
MTVDVTILVGWKEDYLYYESGYEEDTLSHDIEEAAEFLDLNADLVRDLESWDAEYQATYNPVKFRDSGFATPDAKRDWIERGKELSARLKRESPMVASVNYLANGSIPEHTCVF